MAVSNYKFNAHDVKPSFTTAALQKFPQQVVLYGRWVHDYR